MRRIFLIDNNQTMANLTRTALVNKGYDVGVFQDAKKAIEIADQQMPDLIVMDIMLPQQSEGEAAQALSKHPNLRNIPVVFLTGLVLHDEGSENKGITIDGKNYKTLGKPYDIMQLIDIVEKSLN